MAAHSVTWFNRLTTGFLIPTLENHELSAVIPPKWERCRVLLWAVIFTNPTFSDRFQPVITMVCSWAAGLVPAGLPMRNQPHAPGRLCAFPCLAALVICMVAGCGNTDGNLATISVFAAASLTDPFREIAEEFETSNPGTEVKLNFAGSQRLRSQLELGAAADVFASADHAQMSLAEDAGLIAGIPIVFAVASLAVIAHSNSEVHDLSDLAGPGVKLILAHESVPAGHYARLLIDHLSTTHHGLGSDFAEEVTGNVVSEETSVKFVEQKVVLGQADAGIVYRPGALTATATGAARELPLPPGTGEIRALYPIATIEGSDSPGLSARFIEFVLSDPAQTILASYGFDAP